MGTEKKDWVEETWRSFIKDAEGIDPTDPVKAVAAHFEKNASDELKARCRAEGKTAAGCWRFIEAVARRALGGRSGHIDPGVVLAMAMHWFEDVPKDWKERAEARRPDTGKGSAQKPASPDTGKASGGRAGDAGKTARRRAANAASQQTSSGGAPRAGRAPGPMLNGKAESTLDGGTDRSSKRSERAEARRPGKAKGSAQGFFFDALGLGGDGEGAAE